MQVGRLLLFIGLLGEGEAAGLGEEVRTEPAGFSMGAVLCSLLLCYSCLPGYELRPDGACRDIDECLLGQHACSHLCENIPGSYRCRCQAGFSGDPLRPGSCIDVDECSNGSHKCSHICRNTEGSYRCECPEGFTLAQDRRTCLPPKTCLEDPTICQGERYAKRCRDDQGRRQPGPPWKGGRRPSSSRLRWMDVSACAPTATLAAAAVAVGWCCCSFSCAVTWD